MKLAILAGATSRIGEAIARRLATERHSRPDRTQRRSARYRAPENLGLCTTDDADVPRLLVDPGLIIGSRMDRLANIAAFVRVVENGGFAAAARHLNVSPKMGSKHLQELEDQIGARLL